MISRRAFVAGSIALLAGPLSARAQLTEKVHRIGLLASSRQAVDNLKEGLAVLGHREGQSFVIEQRDVEGHFELIPAAVDSLVNLPVDVFVVGGSEYVQAVKNATRTIPVVFTNVGDPVEQGFIASYAKPGGNITGGRRGAEHGARVGRLGKQPRGQRLPGDGRGAPALGGAAEQSDARRQAAGRPPTRDHLDTGDR